MANSVKVSPLPCGLRTHRRDFVFPILQAINELGGSAPISQVLSLVEKRMRGTLNKFDYLLLDSGKSRVEPRWRNTARWAKDGMIQLGMLDSNSPRGIWRITDYGSDMVQILR